MLTNDLVIENKQANNNVQFSGYKIQKSFKMLLSKINSQLKEKHCPSYN